MQIRDQNSNKKCNYEFSKIIFLKGQRGGEKKDNK